MIDRKAEIAQIATKFFSEKGYDNTSTRELAKAAGLSSAGLYYFFQNKEEILFDIINSSLTQLLENVRSAITAEDDPRTNLVRIIDKMVDDVLEHKMEMNLILNEMKRLNPSQLEIITKKRKETLALVKGEIVRLQEHGMLKDQNQTYLTFGLFGVITYTIQWFDPKGPMTKEKFVEETIKLFLK